MNFTIGQAAQKLGLSIHTLRYYEKQGLLPQIQRDKFGNRMYTLDDIKWIYMIRCLRDTGMNIQTIKKYVNLFKQGMQTVPKRKDILLNYREDIVYQIKLFQKVQILLDKKIEYYNKIIEGTNSDRCYDYFDEWEDFKNILEGQFNE